MQSNFWYWFFLWQEGAFAQLKVWQSASIAVVFFINPYISLQVMVEIMLAALFVAAGGFLVLSLRIEKAFSSPSWWRPLCFSSLLNFSCHALVISLAVAFFCKTYILPLGKMVVCFKLQYNDEGHEKQQHFNSWFSSHLESIGWLLQWH